MPSPMMSIGRDYAQHRFRAGSALGTRTYAVTGPLLPELVFHGGDVGDRHVAATE